MVLLSKIEYGIGKIFNVIDIKSYRSIAQKIEHTTMIFMHIGGFL